jgi:hypothetical protein
VAKSKLGRKLETSKEVAVRLELEELSMELAEGREAMVDSSWTNALEGVDPHGVDSELLLLLYERCREIMVE